MNMSAYTAMKNLVATLGLLYQKNNFSSTQVCSAGDCHVAWWMRFLIIQLIVRLGLATFLKNWVSVNYQSSPHKIMDMITDIIH
jgi:hypothetical protein